MLADGGRGTAVSRERFPRASPKRDSKEDLFSRFQTVFGNVVAAPRIRSVSRAGVRGAIILETGGSRIGEMGGNGANFSVDIAMDPNISSVGADQLSNNYSHY